MISSPWLPCVFLSRSSPYIEQYGIAVEHSALTSSAATTTAASSRYVFADAVNGLPLIVNEESVIPFLLERPLRDSQPKTARRCSSWTTLTIGEMVLAYFELQSPSELCSLLSRKRERAVEVDPFDHRFLMPIELLNQSWRLCQVVRFGLCLTDEVWVAPLVTVRDGKSGRFVPTCNEKQAVRRARCELRSLRAASGSAETDTEKTDDSACPPSQETSIRRLARLSSGGAWNSSDIMTQVAVKSMETGGIGFGEGKVATDFVTQ